MSRFANPSAVTRFVLGTCECDGTPHTEDWIDLRAELSGVELAQMEEADPAGRLRLLVVKWNLTGDDGEVAPIDDAYLGRLYIDMFERINEHLTDHLKVRALPNASAVPSRGSSRANGSRTPKTPTGNSSTTHSWPPAAPTGTSGTPPPSS